MTTRAEYRANLAFALGKVVHLFGKPYDEARYRQEIIDAAKQYWKDGAGGAFAIRMRATVKFGLKDAFEIGAKSVGVEANEIPQDALDERDNIISQEQSHIAGLLDYLSSVARSKVKPAPSFLDTVMPRLEMWVKRFSDVQDRARMFLGKKTRLVWKLGATEQHCETCGGLSGIVAWAQEWEQSGLRPKSPDLACHGYNCDCSLTPTTKRRTPNALTRIMDIATRTHL